MPECLQRHPRSGMRRFRAHDRLAFTLLVGVEIETIASAMFVRFVGGVMANITLKSLGVGAPLFVLLLLLQRAGSVSDHRRLA